MGLPLLEALQTGLDSWFARSTSELADDPLRPLPGERSVALQKQIAALGVPLPLRAFVGEALREAVAAWRSDPEAPNVLIVLSRPVEPVSALIEAVLAERDPPFSARQALLPSHRRPVDPDAVPRMLIAALDGSQPPALDTGEPVLLSLPNLDQCFLRCIGGWSGIERLRQVILERRDRFWLLGCNRWAWRFLDHVSQISSYFPDARSLPALDGPQLRQWLTPLASGLGLQQSASGGHPSTDADEDPEVDQWSQLAALAGGGPRIAAALWLESLRLESDSDGAEMRQVRPALPDLPSLTDVDRYILHSLLIHGTMRSEHLAFGLGLPSHRLQPRIHWLLGEGLIEAKAGELSVQPSHYPGLVKALDDNNFFTGEA